MLDQHPVEEEVTGCFPCNSKHVPVPSLPCIQKKFISSPSFFPVFASQQRLGDVISYVIPTVSSIIFLVSTLGTRSKNMLVVTTIGQMFHLFAFYFILFYSEVLGMEPRTLVMFAHYHPVCAIQLCI